MNGTNWALAAVIHTLFFDKVLLKISLKSFKSFGDSCCDGINWEQYLCKIINVFSVKTCSMIQRNVKHTEDTDKNIQQPSNINRLELMLLLMGMSYYRTEGVAWSERIGSVWMLSMLRLGKMRAEMFNLAQLLQQCSAATSSSTMFLRVHPHGNTSVCKCTYFALICPIVHMDPVNTVPVNALFWN